MSVGTNHCMDEWNECKMGVVLVPQCPVSVLEELYWLSFILSYFVIVTVDQAIKVVHLSYCVNYQ